MSKDLPGEREILQQCTPEDFKPLFKLGGGQCGVVFAVQCTRPQHPKPKKLYALKTLYNYGYTTMSMGELKMDTEIVVLGALPPDKTIIRLLKVWEGVPIPKSIITFLPKETVELISTNKFGQTRKDPLKTILILLDYFSFNLETFLMHKPDWSFSGKLFIWANVLHGIMHCATHRFVHNDVKLDNILISRCGSKVAITDFGFGTRLDKNSQLQISPTSRFGGNQSHLSPEVHYHETAPILG